MVDSIWSRGLKKCVRELEAGDYPVWWDGFADVILRGHTSSCDDNPYLSYVADEKQKHLHYRKGAAAAESLLRSLEKGGNHD